MLPDRSRDSPPTSLSLTNRPENPRIPESFTEEIEEETETTDRKLQITGRRKKQ